MSDCFQITLPEELNVRQPVTLIAKSNDHKFQVDVTACQYSKPKQELDQYMSKLQENVLSLKDVCYSVEESGSLHIDGYEARWVLFSFIDAISSPETKNYWHTYRIQSDEYAYTISFVGDYDNLAADRNIINQIVSNFKILK
jgi:hypothetical protein